MKKQKFPETIFTKYEDIDGDDQFLAVHDSRYDAAEKGETVEVGEYRLVTVQKIRLRAEIT